jgi:hypothetical protein
MGEPIQLFSLAAWVSPALRLISLPDAAISRNVRKPTQIRLTDRMAGESHPGMHRPHGPIAQAGQSRRLITGRSQVRILVGPFD